jgi:hypothetical protein
VAEGWLRIDGLGDTDEPCREISLAAAAGLESLIGPDCCRPPLLFLMSHSILRSCPWLLEDQSPVESSSSLASSGGQSLLLLFL